MARTLLAGLFLFSGMAYSSGIVTFPDISAARFSSADMFISPLASLAMDPSLMAAMPVMPVAQVSAPPASSGMDPAVVAAFGGMDPAVLAAFTGMPVAQMSTPPASAGMDPIFTAAGAGMDPAFMAAIADASVARFQLMSSGMDPAVMAALGGMDPAVDPMTGLFLVDGIPLPLAITLGMVPASEPSVPAPVVFTSPAVGITANPEPSTFVLLSLGLAAAAFRWRKRSL
ncbi:MAG: PEP-CTERM sorting domain-containing protein [Acidobacteriia bacterium]|nr:PEP-CTERM sorting domain-containing protein [Terriglobia bacterium]